ncbi:MAG: hypothetical protein ACP5KE_08435 [Candidatus Methanodesulfokora sp.]|jgi:hypothetical protein|nr:MAG: hypothetical protein C0200_05095 [Candidatus Korarchaeota archaeon]
MSSSVVSKWEVSVKGLKLLKIFIRVYNIKHNYDVKDFLEEYGLMRALMSSRGIADESQGYLETVSPES